MLEDSNCENQIEISDEPSLGSKILTDIKIRFSIDMSVFSNKKHFFIKKFNISFNDKSFTYVIPYNVSIPVLYQYSKLGLNLKVFTPDKLKELSDFCVQLRNEIINCEEKGEIVKVYVSIEPYMNLELIKEKIRCFEKECKYIYCQSSELIIKIQNISRKLMYNDLKNYTRSKYYRLYSLYGNY